MAKGDRGMEARRIEAIFNSGSPTGMTDAQLLDCFSSREEEFAELAFGGRGLSLAPRPGGAFGIPGRLP